MEGGDSQDLDLEGKAGFLLHEDGNVTGEGLGSSARFLLYPFIQVAVHTNMIPVFNNANVQRTSTVRDYSQVDVATCLGFDQRYSINRIRSCCDVAVLSTLDILDEFDRWDTDLLIDWVHARLKDHQSSKPLAVVLRGRLAHTSPDCEVLQWLQDRSKSWPRAGHFTIAVHIRRGDTVNIGWERYQLDTYLQALEELERLAPTTAESVVVYTEDNFSVEEEQTLCARFPLLKVQRGTSETMLNDMRMLACADVLVASPSFFSALAGFLLQPESILLLAEDKGGYFRVHEELIGNVFRLGDLSLQPALEKLIAAKALTR